MPLITVDQDRLDVAHFDNGSNWNQRMFRGLANTMQRNTSSTNVDTTSQQQQRQQLHRSESYVLAHLNSAEEEDMSVMTVDTAFRTSLTSSYNNNNASFLQSPASGGGNIPLSGSNMSIMSISEDTAHNDPPIGGLHNATFNLPKRQPQPQQHRQERRLTMTSGNTSKTIQTTHPSRYSTQTYSNRSTIRSSIHSSIMHHSNTNNSSNRSTSGNSSSGSTSHHSISGGGSISMNGTTTTGQRQRKNLLTKHEEQHTLSYNSTRSRSKAVAIYPQPKNRRRKTHLDLPSSTVGAEGGSKDGSGDGAERERRRTTLGVIGDGGAGADNDDTDADLTNQPPLSKPPRARGSFIEQNSTKTLTTSNHSYPTTASSLTTTGGAFPSPISTSSTTRPSSPPNNNEHNALIEGEIMHLSCELANTKTNLDQANMLIRDYQRQAVQFQSLVETLQEEITELKGKLSDRAGGGGGGGGGTRAYIRSDISTVEEGTNSVEELLTSSNGSATKAAGDVKLASTSSTTDLTTASSHINKIDAIVGGTSSATTGLTATSSIHDKHTHYHNRQQQTQHNHPRISPVTATTIQSPSYTGAEIDAMVEHAAHRRRQSMVDANTLTSIGEGVRTTKTKEETHTTSSTGAHRSVSQAGDKVANGLQQQQHICINNSQPKLPSDRLCADDQVIAGDDKPQQGRETQQRQDSGTTIPRNTSSKLMKKGESFTTCTETTDTTASRGGEVGSDTEIFAGDPFATVNGYNDDDVEILDQIASVLNYDLVKPSKVEEDKYDMLAPHNSDYNNDAKVVVPSVWNSLFRRRQDSDRHSQERIQQLPVKKLGIFGF